MSASVMLWGLIAVLLFWWMGAYNRLIRLRAQGIASFAPLETLLGQYLLMVKKDVPHAAMDGAYEVDLGDCDSSSPWLDLGFAAEQFAASLKVAHAHPLNASAIGALRIALERMYCAWSRLQNLPPDLAGSALPSTLQSQWEHVGFQVEVVRAEFSRMVMNYNEAINQFPALLLARVFGFKVAQPL